MARQHEVGQIGEDLARSYLIQQGYEILESNWRYSRAEVDLIARIEETIVFVEVKTRSSDTFGPPEDFVTQKKQLLMTKAASAYMAKNNIEWEIRFDIISIVLKRNSEPKIEHFEDAFFAGL